MDKQPIYINQLSHLVKLICDDKFYAEHFVIYDISDREDVWKRLEKMTERQYAYFTALLAKRKWIDIKKLLDNFLKHK